MTTKHPILFYDGSCGLCHRGVKLALRFDTAGVFRFAPLDGPTCDEVIGAGRRATLPDSVAVWLPEGDRIYTRWMATAMFLRQLGGVMGVLGRIMGWVPPVLGNAAYDLVARHRKRFFAAPTSACPMLPKELRSRFLA